MGYIRINLLLFLDKSFDVSFKRVFRSNGIALKTLISTKYAAPVRLLFCNPN